MMFIDFLGYLNSELAACVQQEDRERFIGALNRVSVFLGTDFFSILRPDGSELSVLFGELPPPFIQTVADLLLNPKDWQWDQLVELESPNGSNPDEGIKNFEGLVNRQSYL